MEGSKKKIILTLDYELFFSKSGTAEKSILYPTSRLLETLAECGAFATFFVDTTYLAKLRQSDDQYDHIVLDQIIKQLQQVLIHGNRIELHLHPHWIDAVKNGPFWTFPNYNHYKLNTLEKSVVNKLFDDGCEILNQLAREVVPNYKVEAFRAGGWCVEPISLFKESLVKNSIRVDSSVCPRLYLSGEVHKIDYRSVQTQDIYTFSDDVRINKENGEFVEVPVNGYYLSPIERFIWVLKSRIHKKESSIWGDGSGIMSVKQHGKLIKLLNILSGKKYFNQFSIDGYVDRNILYRKINESNLQYVTLIAHPKTLSKSSLETVRFLKQKGLDFYTMKEFTDEYCQQYCKIK